MSARVPRPPFTRARVVGAGAVGLSLALALRARGVAHAVDVVDPDEDALARARAHGLDAVPLSSQAEAPVEAVFLATPPSRIASSIEDWAGRAPGALLSDVGSVKRPVLAAAAKVRERVSGLLFVGAHPIAGTERRGGGSARPDLFAGRTVVLCPLEDVAPAALSSIERAWQLLGAVPITLSAAEHDRWLALTSHLPLVAASALAALASGHLAPGTHEELLVGPGFLDTTRVAASPPELWAEILSANADHTAPLVRALAGKLEEAAARLEEPLASGSREQRLAEWLEPASSFRRRLGEA